MVVGGSGRRLEKAGWQLGGSRATAGWRLDGGWMAAGGQVFFLPKSQGIGGKQFLIQDTGQRIELQS